VRLKACMDLVFEGAKVKSRGDICGENGRGGHGEVTVAREDALNR